MRALCRICQPPGPLSTLRKGEKAVARCPHSDRALGESPFGGIAFSHSDLGGATDHRNVFIESSRTVSQLLDRVFT